jgi:peptidoglycan-N-acetylglucosamine deacetylase
MKEHIGGVIMYININHKTRLVIIFFVMLSLIVNFLFIYIFKNNGKMIKDKNELINELNEDVSRYTDDIKNLMDLLMEGILFSTEEFHQCRYQQPRNENNAIKRAYLTFDDGPSIYTNYFLDVLKMCDVKATFFIVGKNAERYAETVKRMENEGHMVGNHGYSHRLSSMYRSKENFETELERTHQIIYNITGRETNLFRFPGGSSMVSRRKLNKYIESLYERGYYYFDWNVSTGDGFHQSSKGVIRNLERGIIGKNTVVILMHDIKKSTLIALPEVIRILREEGFKISTLNEHTYKAQHR